ncbi:hypothetical protein UVI_02020750 [Ustilaginoidea virens]|uniref:Uncharacterized protein n=1 Tax=Ustilaginoidea virens TaxID=1159556 RepID=A0A1B5KX35_USTVR|nr:hypothetical protein UVI_02020750 [Ustilaginoidea virens]
MSGLLAFVLGGDGKNSAIDLPAVDVHHIETNPERPARSLKHLLKANHVNYAVLCSQSRSGNETAHALASAYLLGATATQLQDMYEEQVKELEPWKPSPAEVVDNDWVDFLGDDRYQRGFLDFFEDKLAMEYAYDWKKVVEHFLFSSERPLVHGLICGCKKHANLACASRLNTANGVLVGHPLTHLGYAYEMDSKEVAMEALTLASVQHSFLYKYTSDPSCTRQSSKRTSASVLELLVQLSDDEALRDLPEAIEPRELESTISKYEGTVLDYWNAWDISEPVKDFEKSQQAAVGLFVSSVDPTLHEYSLLFADLLTTSYAVRVLLSFFPARYHVSLVKEWWLLVVAVFILKGRPRPKPGTERKDAAGRDWNHVQQKALQSPHLNDAHYAKGTPLTPDAPCNEVEPLD